jgi:hypothetical protein
MAKNRAAGSAKTLAAAEAALAQAVCLADQAAEEAGEEARQANEMAAFWAGQAVEANQRATQAAALVI